MNIRKNIDYSEMYEALDRLMAQQLPPMELYCAIGKAICRRTEKGAAVMAAEYLHEHYPDVPGFSPRNVRRMRDFYRTYENHPQLLKLAMQIDWIQNVVIMGADLSMELREWYLKAAKRFWGSKSELIANIAADAHEKITLDTDLEICFNEGRRKNSDNTVSAISCCAVRKNYLVHLVLESIQKIRRRWYYRRHNLIQICNG